MENLINSIIAISTVATLVVIWQTLKEMKIQRQKLFEPIILPINFSFYLLSNFPQVLLPINCSTKKDDVINSIHQSSSLKLKNIGQGIAKNILVEVSWKINFKEYFEFLQVELEKNDIVLKLDISDSGCWISIDELNKINSGGNFPYQYESIQKFDYLLPLTNYEEEEGIIEIPSCVELMFELFVLLMESASREHLRELFEIFKKKFKINIKIEYRDNLDNSFYSNYELILLMPKIQMSSSYIGKLYTFGVDRK